MRDTLIPEDFRPSETPNKEELESMFDTLVIYRMILFEYLTSDFTPEGPNDGLDKDESVKEIIFLLEEAELVKKLLALLKMMYKVNGFSSAE